MTTDANCVFCKIVAGTIPCFKLFEDEHTIAFMDINPGNDGHALAIPKAHHPDLYAMPPDLIGAVARTTVHAFHRGENPKNVAPSRAGESTCCAGCGDVRRLDELRLSTAVHGRLV